MNRRDAIARVGLLVGGTVVGANVFLTGCARKSEVAASGLTFTPENISFLDEVGETILPTTASSPGAKEAKIGEFMKAIVSDCYEEKDQKVFGEIFTKLDQSAKKKFSKIFLNLAPVDRQSLLIAIDKEAKEYQKSKKADDTEHYFTLTKQLILWGYFTSEIGSTKALRYLPVPGHYEGCAPYKKGDKAWAQT
jgi:hypothetical protein